MTEGPRTESGSVFCVFVCVYGIAGGKHPEVNDGARNGWGSIYIHRKKIGAKWMNAHVHTVDLCSKANVKMIGAKPSVK